MEAGSGSGDMRLREKREFISSTLCLVSDAIRVCPNSDISGRPQDVVIELCRASEIADAKRRMTEHALSLRRGLTAGIVPVERSLGPGQTNRGWRRPGPKRLGARNPRSNPAERRGRYRVLGHPYAIRGQRVDRLRTATVHSGKWDQRELRTLLPTRFLRPGLRRAAMLTGSV